MQKSQWFTLLMGAVAIAAYFLFANLPTPEGLSLEGQKALALTIATIILWVFEVLPIGISSVVALLMLPLTGIVKMGDAMSTFAIPTIFFILSSFCFANGFIKTGLGYRASLSLSTMFGNKSSMVILAFMVATSAISTVLADIPTAIVFASIAYPILQNNNCTPGKSNFGKALMMGIPIAAAIGGFGTPAGSGLNVLALNLLKNTSQIEVNFLQWSIIGLPFAALLTLAAWYVLMKMLPLEIDVVRGLDNVQAEKAKLGPMSLQEKKFCLIFASTVLLWFTSIWTKLDIATIAVVMSALLFLPFISILEWEPTKKNIGWEVLLLVGTSNALAMTMKKMGAADWIAASLLGGITDSSMVLLLFLVIAFGIFSHLILPVGSAALAVAVPVISLLATKLGINPAILVVPLAYTASCVFLLPLDPIPLTTYQYGYWKITDMMKPGFIISLIWLVLLTGIMYAATLAGIF